MHHPTDRITHTSAFVTPVVEHWLEREIAQWVHSMKDRSDDPSHHERTLLSRSYISLPVFGDCYFCQDLRNKKPNSVCSSHILSGVTTSVMKVTLLLFVP